MASRPTRDVFVNCPFDAQYLPIFRAIVFTVIRSGFRARSAQEDDDSGTPRFSKILQIVEECRYGIHDISRTEVDGDPPLPRFNMPLELGAFLGAKRYGDEDQKRKKVLVLDREPHRYQRLVSDIAGQDIRSHSGDPAIAAREVATWLRIQSRSNVIPGGVAIAAEYAAFLKALPGILNQLKLDTDEMTFGDYTTIVTEYVALL